MFQHTLDVRSNPKVRDGSTAGAAPLGQETDAVESRAAVAGCTMHCASHRPGGRHASLRTLRRQASSYLPHRHFSLVDCMRPPIEALHDSMARVLGTCRRRIHGPCSVVGMWARRACSPDRPLSSNPATASSRQSFRAVATLSARTRWSQSMCNCAPPSGIAMHFWTNFPCV
jgi:hypothetical protein